MKRILQILFALFVLLLIVYAACTLIFFFAIYPSSPPVSTFSGYHTTEAVSAYLNTHLTTGSSTRAQVEQLARDQGVTDCQTSDTLFVCWTAAPRIYALYGDRIRDLGNFLFINWYYQIRFAFEGDILTGIEVTLENIAL